MQVKFHIVIVVTGLLAGIPGVSAQPGPGPQVADPVLQGLAPPVACADALEGADYVPGMDANGQPVARTDIGAERVPVPGEVLVPLPNRARPTRSAGRRSGRGSRPGQGDAPYIALDGQRLERLVNPAQPCQPGTR